MGNFRSDDRNDRNRSSGFSNRSSGGSRYGGRSEGRSGGFGRDRNSRNSERPREMHDVICDKCKKECQVPFRPSGDKPVLCSDCFRKSEGSSRSFGPRNRGSSSSRMSSEELSKINVKLDKIIKALKIDSE